MKDWKPNNILPIAFAFVVYIGGIYLMLERLIYSGDEEGGTLYFVTASFFSVLYLRIIRDKTFAFKATLVTVITFIVSFLLYILYIVYSDISHFNAIGYDSDWGYIWESIEYPVIATIIITIIHAFLLFRLRKKLLDNKLWE